MPGKVNPVIPEAVTQVACQVVGNDAAIAFGGASGAFELNVYIPMMARNLLESFRLLANSSRLFAEKCIDGLVANEERLRKLAESSPSIVTPLNRAIGYEEAAKVAKQALAEGKTIRQTVIDRGLVGEELTLEELDELLDVLAMARVKDNDYQVSRHRPVGASPSAAGRAGDRSGPLRAIQREPASGDPGREDPDVVVLSPGGPGQDLRLLGQRDLIGGVQGAGDPLDDHAPGRAV